MKIRENLKSNLITIATLIVLCLVLVFMMCYAEKSRIEMQKGDDVVCTTILMTSTGVTSEESSTTTTSIVTKKTTTTTAQTTTRSTITTTSQAIVTTIETSSESNVEPTTIASIQEPNTEPYVEQQPLTEAYIEPDTQPYVEPETEPPVQLAYSESDAILLAQLINKEASASWEGKVAVGSCVINRANRNGMSIYDVIFQKGQFTTAYSLGYYSDTDYQAAVQVLTYGSSDSRIYFFNGGFGDGLNRFWDYNYNFLYCA